MTHLSTTMLIVGGLVSLVIPGLSSLLNVGKLPPAASGPITVVLAIATGFLTEWAAKGDSYDWKQGVLNAVGAYVLAALARHQLWAGIETDKALLALGKPHQGLTPAPRRVRRRARPVSVVHAPPDVL